MLTGVPCAMEPLLLLWLVLAGASAQLLCPEGQPCPPTPVSAQGQGGGTEGCPQLVGNSPLGVPCHPLPRSDPVPREFALSRRGQLPTAGGESPAVPQFPPLPAAFGGGACPPSTALPSPPLCLPRESPALAATAAVPKGPSAALTASPVSPPQVLGGGQTLQGGGGPHGCAWGCPSPRPCSLQPSVLSLVPTDSPSVPIMPRAA